MGPGIPGRQHLAQRNHQETLATTSAGAGLPWPPWMPGRRPRERTSHVRSDIRASDGNRTRATASADPGQLAEKY